MARIFIEGFEGDSSLTGYSTANGPEIAAARSGMSGDSCLYCDASNSWAAWDLGVNLSEAYISFKYQPSDDGARCILTFRDSANTQVLSLYRQGSTWKLRVALGRASSGTVLCSSNVMLFASSTYLIEAHYIPLNSGGTIEVKIDGVSVCSFTGDTTAGLENIRYIQFGQEAYDGYCYIDDVVVDDSDWVGNVQVLGLYPNGAGATTQFSCPRPTNYGAVADGDVTATYTWSNTNNQIDTFATENLPAATGGINCIQLSILAKKVGTPTPTQLAGVIRPASTDRVHGTPVTPTTTLDRYDFLWAVNPEDSAAFEDADIDAMEIGYKAVA